MSVSGFFRGLAVAICAYLLGVLLIFAATAAVFTFFTSKPSSIKTVLQNSGIYERLPNTILDNYIKKQSVIDRDSAPLQQPEIRDSVNAAFSPQILQTNGEELVDGVYDWLNGKTSQPNFTLDFTASKQILASGVGAYAEKRANGLPVCTLAQLRQLDAAKIQAFSADCLPPGVSASQARAQVENEIAADREFLPDPVLTSTSLKDENGKPVFSTATQEVPNRFQQLKSVFWVLLGACALLAAGVIFLSTERFKGLGRLGKVLVSAAVFIAILPLSFGYLLPKIIEATAGKADNTTSALVLPVFQEFASATAPIYYIFALILSFIGVTLLVYAHRRKTL